MDRVASDRRRLVEPSTCKCKWSTAELKFMRAMREHERRSARLFPTWSELLDSLEDPGYRKQS